MPLYKLTENELTKVVRTNFAAVKIRERQDLQRILRDQVEVLDQDIFVLSEEFGKWEEGKRRIDLLAIDRNANIVVIELKRTEDGGYMELQAIRYASLVANMTFEQAIRAHKEYLVSRNIDEDAEQRLLEFLGWDGPNEEDFGADIRIILVSGDFSKELTTSVLWLNEKGLDVRCIRLRPYKLDDQLILQVEQILPLPEAQEYIIGVREKQRSELISRTRDLTRFDLEIDGKKFIGLAKRQAIVRVAMKLCEVGASPEELADIAGRSINAVWRWADGALDSNEIFSKLKMQAEAGGPAFQPGRWFFDDEFLIKTGGKTWAFTKMWGIKTEEVMSDWISKYPQANVIVTRSS